MLRVTDILLRNLVWAVVELDLRDSLISTHKDINLNNLIEKIRCCGISFKVKCQCKW
jgi:hypothetical protein